MKDHSENALSGEISSEPAISRREFLLRVGATTALIAGGVVGGAALWQKDHFIPGFEEQQGLTLPSYRIEASKVLPSLAIAHGTEHSPVIRAAIDALGGMERFVKKGDIVLIKPNVGFDRSPALAATTHPDALRAVARLVLEAGASKVLVADNPITAQPGVSSRAGCRRWRANSISRFSTQKRIFFHRSKSKEKFCATGLFSTSLSRKRPR